MSLHPAAEGGFTATCDGCGRLLDWQDEDGDYIALLQGDDPEDEISAYGWERWEDGHDRCGPCMNEAIASGEVPDAA